LGSIESVLELLVEDKNDGYRDNPDYQDPGVKRVWDKGDTGARHGVKTIAHDKMNCFQAPSTDHRNPT
jgi:hypothetical protein